MSCSILALDAETKKKDFHLNSFLLADISPKNEQLLPPSKFGFGEHSLIEGVFGRMNCFGRNGLISFLWEGEVRLDLLADFDLLIGGEDTGELDSTVNSAMEGDEDLELELDRDIVSVHRANLVKEFKIHRIIYKWTSVF